MSDIVAVFWNFEHLHDALLLQKHGKPGLKKYAGRLQPSVVNVEAIMDLARSFGQVVYSEAFGNWQFMGRYANAFRLEETHLVQVFPENFKQPADVFPTLVSRVKTFVDQNEEISTVLMVGQDNDYVQLAEDLKALGCTVHALGAEGLNNQEIQAAADSYRDYYDLAGVGDRPDAPKPGGGRSGDLSKFYLRVAAQQGVRMPPPKVMWIGIDIYASFLKDYGHFNSFKELDDECYDQLVQDIPAATMTEVKKIRQVLFKCYLFRPSEDGKISFQENITSLKDIEDCYFDLMLRRIANNLNEPTDYVALSRALTGGPEVAERLELQHAEMKKQA